MKFILEMGPILIFFAAYKLEGLMVATAILIALTLLSLPILYKIEGKLPIASIVTAVLVTVFGGLTLWLDDERFIKMKPTIIYLIFAAILFGGLYKKKPLLKPLMEKTIQLTNDGWVILTRNFGMFFITLAIANEFVWRSFDTDFWVNFKTFGLPVFLTIFMISQISLLKKHIITK